MNQFTNILTLFYSSDIQPVHNFLYDRGFRFYRIGNTIYLNTPFRQDSQAIAAYLSSLNIQFSYIHININSGSYAITNLIDASSTAAIRAIVNPAFRY